MKTDQNSKSTAAAGSSEPVVRPFRVTHLAGRSRSGSEHNGSVTHAVIGWTAICGKRPGDKSAGWSEWTDDEITCQKCKRIAANERITDAGPVTQETTDADTRRSRASDG